MATSSRGLDRRAVGRPKGGDADVTRARLLAAARELFERHGYEATSVAEICRAADVTHPALYHHFESKAGIYVAVVKEVGAFVAATYDDSIRGLPRLRDRFPAVLRVSIELVRGEPGLSQFTANQPTEIRRHEELSVLRTEPRPVQRFLAGLVDDAVATGELAPDVDRRAVVDVLDVVLRGLAQLAAGGDLGRYERVSAMAEALVAGQLLAPPAPPLRSN